MRFEWDPTKDVINQRKHNVSFTEAKELFTSNCDYVEFFDHAHSDTEERFIAIGPIQRGIVAVVWTERVDDVVRIISARWATKQEKLLYLQYMGERT